MGANTLRYASEGPFVENAEGGGAQPGQGFRLRSVFLTAQPIASLETAANTTPLTSSLLTMSGVRTAKRYRADLVLHAQKNDAWTATTTVAWTVEYSADSGTTWTTWFTQTNTYGGELAHDMSENVTEVVRVPPTLGSALTGVSDGDDIEVRVRGVLGAAAMDNNFTFASQTPGYILELMEEL